MKPKNRVILLKDARRGMILVPFVGVSYGVAVETLDWTATLTREWWQHIVIHIDEEVRLARPYAYSHRDMGSHSPLIGCEVYSVPIHSQVAYMVIREDMSI